MSDVKSLKKALKRSLAMQNREKENLENQMHRKSVEGSFSTHLRSLCYKIERSKRMAPTEAYGRHYYCDLIVFGMKTKAPIDTGSVISVIPVGFSEKAEKPV